jgi:hypothetical protein
MSKLSDLGSLGAVNCWVFCDESMSSLNDGYLECSMVSPAYPDVPANYDCGGNCFSFVDGHVEYRKWLYHTSAPRSGLLNVPYAYNHKDNNWLSSGFDIDYLWLRQHTAHQ